MISAPGAALDGVTAALHALESVHLVESAYRDIDDAGLLELTAAVARLRERATALGAVLAGEIAHRSAPQLGSGGLAQRTGFRTPVELVKASTRSSARDAITAVRVGRLIYDAAGSTDPATGEVQAPAQPWLNSVVGAMSGGCLSMEAADAISSGIGSPNSSVDEEQLRAAVDTLVDEAMTLDPDRLYKRARFPRDELDVAGVALREEERRQQRSLRLITLPTGMGRLVWTMPPETLAAVKDIYDRMTSPKLGGVRFVADDAAGRAAAIVDDPRSPEQLASDGFEQLLRLGADTDPRFLMGSGAPVITIITTAPVFATGVGTGDGVGIGVGRIEGQTDPVGLSTIERHACNGAVIDMVFDSQGQPLDVGREQRLFTARQRRALAVRDGGCRAPGCDRPPSWTEAHHVKHWARDHGPTDLANGMLLCKHHHLLFHNNGWEIQVDAEHRYWLIPPSTIDPAQTPRPMPTKSLAFADLTRRAAV